MVRQRKSHVSHFPVILAFDWLVLIRISAQFLTHSVILEFIFDYRYATSYTLIRGLTGEPLTLYIVFVHNHITEVCGIYPFVPLLQVSPSHIGSRKKLEHHIFTYDDKKVAFLTHIHGTGDTVLIHICLV